MAMVALGLLSALACAASDLTVALDYEIAPILRRCPAEAEFRSQVAGQLGYDPFRDDSALRVTVRAGPSERGTEGRVEWQDASGNARGDRQFVGTNRECAQLVAEMSFAVAVQIQLLRTLTQPGTTSSRSVTSRGSDSDGRPSSPSDTAAAPPRPLPPPPASGGLVVRTGPPAWSLFAGGGPAVGFGLGPTPTISARLFVALQDAGASIELGAEVGLPATERRSDGSGFREDAIATELGLCGHLDRFAFCGLGRLGRIWVHGFGVDRPASPSGLVAQLGARLTATQPLGARFSVSLHADGLALLTPWTVDLNQTDAWTMPPFGAAIGFDMAARFR
jgi:hypothetical protein